MSGPRAASEGRQWDSRSFGSRFQHSLFYALIRVGGRQAAHFVLFFVVLYYLVFRPSLRARSTPYLVRRFPHRRGWAQFRDAFRLSLEFGRMLVDRAVLGILGPQALRFNVSERENLARLLEEGHGLILLTAHVGAWQMGMTNLSPLAAPINLVIHREPGDVDRHFFEHGDQASPLKFIDPTGELGGVLAMLQALKHKEVLSIMGDRAMGSRGSNVAVTFLGGTVQVPVSPYLLGSATGAPIAVIFPYKTETGGYALQIAGVIRVPQDLGRAGSQYQPYAQEFANALEAFVAEHPYQFFNFFDLWNLDPA